jgi:predicted amidophosphoribosyltransferase
MHTNRQKILDYITKNRLATPHELAGFLGIGPAMVHRYLRELLEQGTLVKQGSSPKVFYALKGAQHTAGVSEYGAIPIARQNLISENFTLVSPDGTETDGWNGFVRWCLLRGYDSVQKSAEYEQVFNEYKQFQKNGIIDATQKIQNIFPGNSQPLEHLYFLYPYSLPVFGKTKIATWLFHGKQTQNKMLIKRVLNTVIPQITTFISTQGYDAVAFVPPSVPREFQFMKQLQSALATTLSTVKIEKIKNSIIIQQKSLKDLQDRIQNADTTLVVTGRGSYKKMLIIDDFTGSGSTLSVLAKKIQEKGIAKHIDGLTITGSMNGFEIVKEV